MAVLALKELQAHTIQSGASMAGALQPYVLTVPMQDFHLQEDGQPLDLQQLVAQQDSLQQQRQQQEGSAQRGAADPAAAADGLGSLEDFIASDGSEAAAATPAAGDSQADLASLMPQVALTAQQLQLQLLQLLERHHFSTQELQRRLLQQVDVAEAYYNAHIAGTPLEQLLLQQHSEAAAGDADGEGEAARDAAAAAAAAAAAGDAAAVQRPAWLDFAQQRRAIEQQLAALQPLLATAGDKHAREAGQLLVQLDMALEQQQDVAGLVAAADAATLARAFNLLEVSKRQALLDSAPEARAKLNLVGTDLRAAVDTSSSSRTRLSDLDVDSSAEDSSSSSGLAFSARTPWPWEVPGLVDVWGHEEIPRQQLADLQAQLPELTALMAGLQAATGLAAGSSSSDSGGSLGGASIDAVEQAVQLYCGLLHEYDKVRLLGLI
jgi:hypothetical protein